MALRVSKAELPSEFRESMIKQFGTVAEPAPAGGGVQFCDMFSLLGF